MIYGTGRSATTGRRENDKRFFDRCEEFSFGLVLVLENTLAAGKAVLDQAAGAGRKVPEINANAPGIPQERLEFSPDPRIGGIAIDVAVNAPCAEERFLEFLQRDVEEGNLRATAGLSVTPFNICCHVVYGAVRVRSWFGPPFPPCWINCK
jgi:hypothetical protein